jgi:hypothetical protein
MVSRLPHRRNQVAETVIAICIVLHIPSRSQLPLIANTDMVGGHKPTDDGVEFGKAVAPNRAPPESRVSERDIKEISRVWLARMLTDQCDALGVSFARRKLKG